MITGSARLRLRTSSGVHAPRMRPVEPKAKHHHRLRQGFPAPGPQVASKETTRFEQQVENLVPFTNVGPSRTQTGMIVLFNDWLQVPPAILDLSIESDRNIMDSVGYLRRSNSLSNHGSAMTTGQIPTRLSSDIAGVVIDVPKWSLGTEISTSQLTRHELSNRLKRQAI